MDERIYCGIETLHFKGKAGEKTLSAAVCVNFAFIQIKSKVNKKSRLQLLTLLHFKGKAGEKTLSGAVYVFFYSSKVKGKQEKQVTHTYPLIKAKIFMETTK